MWFDERKIIIMIITIFISTTILDIVTALTSPIFKAAETNPVFLTFGVWPLAVINLVYIIYFVYNIKKEIKLSRLFLFITTTMMISYGHIVGIYYNLQSTLQYIKNPVAVTQIVENLTKADKVSGYIDVIGWKILFPYIIFILCFYTIFYLYQCRRPIREKYIEQGVALIRKAVEDE